MKRLFSLVFLGACPNVFSIRRMIGVDVIANTTKVGSWNTSLCLHKMALILAKLCLGKSTIN